MSVDEDQLKGALLLTSGVCAISGFFCGALAVYVLYPVLPHFFG